MIKIILAFLVVFGVCYFGINGYRDLSGKEKWALTKLLGYSILVAVLTLVVLIVFVIAF